MNEFLNNHQTGSTNDEWEKAMQNIIGHIGRTHQQEKSESTPQYEFLATDVKDVIKNAEQYIIPEYLKAFKDL